MSQDPTDEDNNNVSIKKCTPKKKYPTHIDTSPEALKSKTPEELLHLFIVLLARRMARQDHAKWMAEQQAEHQDNRANAPPDGKQTTIKSPVKEE